MTPLAYQSMKAQHCSIGSVSKNLPDIRGIHCFEVSAIRSMIEDVSRMVDRFKTFLPAPKTWIERRNHLNPTMRTGFYIEEGVDGAAVWRMFNVGHDCVSASFCGTIGLFDRSGEVNPDANDKFFLETYDAAWATPETEARGRSNILSYNTKQLREVVGLLAIINSPRVIGRKQIMPHRGIEKRLSRAMKAVGKFPLQAWTEITLNVSKPIEVDDGEIHEAHLTGKRALHFCRSHIRIRYGQLEYVTSHWRGDAAIGIKQSRYKVVA